MLSYNFASFQINKFPFRFGQILKNMKRHKCIQSKDKKQNIFFSIKVIFNL